MEGVSAPGLFTFGIINVRLILIGRFVVVIVVAVAVAGVVVVVASVAVLFGLVSIRAIELNGVVIAEGGIVVIVVAVLVVVVVSSVISCPLGVSSVPIFVVVTESWWLSLRGALKPSWVRNRRANPTIRGNEEDIPDWLC